MENKSALKIILNDSVVFITIIIFLMVLFFSFFLDKWVIYWLWLFWIILLLPYSIIRIISLKDLLSNHEIIKAKIIDKYSSLEPSTYGLRINNIKEKLKTLASPYLLVVSYKLSDKQYTRAVGFSIVIAWKGKFREIVKGQEIEIAVSKKNPNCFIVPSFY